MQHEKIHYWIEMRRVIHNMSDWAYDVGFTRARKPKNLCKQTIFTSKQLFTILAQHVIPAA